MELKGGETHKQNNVTHKNVLENVSQRLDTYFSSSTDGNQASWTGHFLWGDTEENQAS